MKFTVQARPLLIAAMLWLAACGPASAPTPIPTIVLEAGAAASSSSVDASGVIVPAHKAQLGFPLTGVVRTVAVKEGDKVVKGQQLAALDTTILEARVRVADANVRAAQIQYKYLYRTGTRDQEHLDSALADVAREQALLDSAAATLAQANLVSPIDGTVAAVKTSAAETVVPGQVVIIVGDLTDFRAETTDLSESDAPSVQIGQTASISVSALNQDFPGRVADISRISDTVGGDVVFKVTLAFDSQPAGLLWGMTTHVHITTGP
jgi:RND family efflux transporter MFP subunit